MNPADLPDAAVRALSAAVDAGELGAARVPRRVPVERTRPGGVGEYASPVALQVAGAAGMKPLDVARVLAVRLEREPGVRAVEITGPGFLNFTLDAADVGELVRAVAREGERYGFGPGHTGVPPREELDHAGELRRQVVGGAVRRIRASQGLPAGDAPEVAPLRRSDHDVVRRFGEDAARWGMLRGGVRETPEFTARLAVQDESSEYFQVRYAQDRVRALTRNAALLGFRADPGEGAGEDTGDDTGEAGSGAGVALVTALREYPLALEAAARRGEPERLVRQLVVVADALLDFQYLVLPVGDEKPEAAHRARLALAEAAGTVLAGGLALLGIPSSPESFE
ncbi:ArgS-related anticodon-binding protein NrtL [Streptomyces sp. NPDC012888]|uniref:ArgS-related anticodon-binding protein NrtL n=1 Tax=Streptomyces sp. NPDC012888 TaxID=3364855 RepID=UPI0036BBA97E